MPAGIEIYGDDFNLQISDTKPSLVLKQKIRIDTDPIIWPGNNPGNNWKYAEIWINAEAPMIAFIGDPYAFFPQVTETAPGQFKVRMWTNTPTRIQGWAYVFDTPQDIDSKYFEVRDPNGKLTYTIGQKPMRIVGQGLVAPTGFVEETIPPFIAGRTYAGVICAPATSTFAQAFTCMGVGNGQGHTGRTGLFGNPVSIPKIGTGGSPNQAVIGRVLCVDVTGY